MSHRNLNVHDVYEKLRVSEMTVYRLIRAGEIATQYDGYRHEIKYSDFTDFLSRHRLGKSRLRRRGWGNSFASLDFLTPNEAGEELGLTGQTVRQYIHCGELSAVQFQPRGSCIIERAELDAFRRDMAEAGTARRTSLRPSPLRSNRRLTFVEVGSLLGVSQATVGRLVKTGKLSSRATKQGKRRVYEEDVRCYLDDKNVLMMTHEESQAVLGQMRQPFLTVKELAEEWRVAEITIIRIIRTKELRAYRVSNQYRVVLADALNYLERSRTDVAIEAT